MKILFTYEYPFHKFGYGGGQEIIRGLSKSLTSLGHEVIVACLGSDELNLNKIDYPVKFKFQYDYKVGFCSFLFASLGSIRLINKYKPDFVLSFSSESAILSIYCKLKNIPFYIYIAAPYLPVFKVYNFKTYLINIRYHLPLYLQYIGCFFANKIFTISDYISLQAIVNWKINKNKIQTLGCAISEIVISHQAGLVDKNKCIRIATTGRLMYSQKPIDILAKCLSQLNNIPFEWHIIGTGMDLENFKILLANLGIQKSTILHSTLSTLEICKLYDKIDLVILPSNNESFFITAYEAICLNKILVTNKVALLDKIFTNYNSIIFSDNVSVDAYAKSIYRAIKLLNDKNINTDLKIASAFVKNNFNWKKIGNKLIKNI